MAQSGHGLATAGLVLSLVWTPIWVIVAVSLFVSNASLVTGTTDSSPVVKVGECFVHDNLGEIDCGKPHDNEVVAILELSRWPKDNDDPQMKDRCTAELSKYSSSAGRDPHVHVEVWGPDTSWKYMNNHTATCIAHFTPDRVGSIKD